MAESSVRTAYDSLTGDFVPGINPPSAQISSYWFIFCEEELLVFPDNEKDNLGATTIPKAIKPPSIAPATFETFQFLGWYREAPCYAGTITQKCVLPAGARFDKLRPLFGVLPEPLFAIAGMASQILYWERTHRYCGQCGSRTQYIPGQRATRCTKCGLDFYPRITPAVLVAVTKGDSLLLAWSARWTKSVYSVIAGFVEPGETLEQCAAREVMEETSISVQSVRYFASQPWPFPSQLMVAFTAEYKNGTIHVDNNELNEAAWFTRDNLPELPAPLSLSRILIDCWKQHPG